MLLVKKWTRLRAWLAYNKGDDIVNSMKQPLPDQNNPSKSSPASVTPIVYIDCQDTLIVPGGFAKCIGPPYPAFYV